ncbi:MAG: hypothetical protein MJ219_04205 [Mycoplasmoidaceae bacterium]|nr:hypothetical protein [Mycoplasmoidaceae bacterium]
MYKTFKISQISISNAADDDTPPPTITSETQAASKPPTLYPFLTKPDTIPLHNAMNLPNSFLFGCVALATKLPFPMPFETIVILPLLVLFTNASTNNEAPATNANPLL